MRRPTLALSIGQLVSWGVLFYSVPVATPSIVDEPGWPTPVLPLCFSAALLIAGLGAPATARAVVRRGGRTVLTFGSLVGAAAMSIVATAPTVALLGVGFLLLGVAMSTVLYEPAMTVLVALDPDHRGRNLALLTVAGGLASTVFAPLTAITVDALGWRLALALLGTTGGAFTAILHRTLPKGEITGVEATVQRHELPSGYRHLRAAHVLEQTANIATTAGFVGLLVSRGADPATAALLLAMMGLGKTMGRLVLVRATATTDRSRLLAGLSVAQFAGLLVLVATDATAPLYAVVFAVGAMSGATTVLRPLLVSDVAGTQRFAAVNARLQRASSVARAGGPAALSAGAAVIGWSAAWVLTLGLFVLAADRYRRIDGHRAERDSPNRRAIALRGPPDRSPER